MSSWPSNTTYLGKDTRRLDGPVKVSGQAKYSYDVQPEGWLYGMILRSKWPSAKVLAIHLDKARAIPGIKAVIAIKEGEQNVHYYGEELAAVAGTSKQACLDALHAIRVDAVPQPFVVSEEFAMQEGAPQVFPGEKNISGVKVSEHGDVDAAWGRCTAIVDGFFSTPVQIHNALETHGLVASANGDELTIWASTQGITSVREGLASNLNIPQSKIRVISDFMGGGFGAKFGPGVEGVLAVKLSQAAGAPVKLLLPRFDEMLAVGNRPSTFQKVKLGADASGKLIAYELESFGTGGYASGGDTAGGGGQATFPAPYIYQVENSRSKQTGVAINAGASSAFRAPGHPPASFGMESIMDELAVKLGMDPLELRLRNDPHPIRQKEYRVAAEKFGWKDKYKKPGTSPGTVKTGIGCASSTWGGSGKGTQAEAQVNPDGTIEIRCGTQDLGTGTKTLIAVVAAEILGLKPQDITPKIGDTNYPPSGGSGGSTTAASVSPAIYDTCTNVIEELKKASGMDDVRGGNWKTACKKLGVNPLVVHGKWQPGLSSGGTGGVQMAEVDVDTETGFVKVKKVLVVQDCGLVVNKLTCESQLNGGVIMGMGYALYEGRVMDSASGVVLNPNFETYKLSGAGDIPQIDVVLIDMPERGVIGVGEPATIPTAAAIANAVANAIGVRVSSLPMTPDKVLTALGKVPNRSPQTAAEEAHRAFAALTRAIAQPA